MRDYGRQFSQRLKAYMDALKEDILGPGIPVAFEGFVSDSPIPTDEAEKGPFRPMPPGTPWGAKWQYGYFRAEAAPPDTWEGLPLALTGGMGGEQLYYVNGAAAGTVDRGHPFLYLTFSHVRGRTYRVLCESYAGHGPRLESLGPCPPEKTAVPEPPPFQCTMEEGVLRPVCEDARQLYLDMFVLTDLLPTLKDNSLRALRIMAALDEVTHIADPELPRSERPAAYRAGREALKSCLSCRNGSTSPEMYLIGQSHIDLAWLWPEKETRRKAVRTYATQAQLMERYPSYRFLMVEPALMEMLRTGDPPLWERVLAALRRGQVCPDGAFYVECDTNLPSGESLIRQLSLGRRWFRSVTGTESTVAFLPDCFGFSAVLPQLFKKTGVRYFATQKLMRADPECQPFPYQDFIWEGMDGSCVQALSFMRDNGPVSPFTFHRRWYTERAAESACATVLHPFGFGDGGGGPTADMVEIAQRLQDLEGCPRSSYHTLREYFEAVAPDAQRHRWTGELYLAWHRGTWTSQRRQKQMMRRAEEALSFAEAAVSLLDDPAEENASLSPLWERLLFCQFHDVAGGAGIRRVHEEAERDLEKAVSGAYETALRAVRSLASPSDGGISFINPLPWAREEYVRLPGGKTEYISVPASGWAPAVGMPGPEDARACVRGNMIVMENRFLSLAIAPDGSIASLTDKENGLPLISEGQRMNDWRLYANIQPVYDAWEMDRDWESRRIPDPFETEVTLVSSGGAAAECRVRRRFSQSEAVQVIRLTASSRRVDFETELDWHERRRMLKCHFESNILTDNAIHEMQFGHVLRPCHRSDAFAADRYEVPQHRFSALAEENRGFALLNNGIYALSTGRGELALTLCRAPLVPDDRNNLGRHVFTYSLYPFASSFASSGVIREGYALNRPLIPFGGRLEPFEGPSVGPGPVILETVKPALDGDGIILRLYQSLRQTGSGTVTLPWMCDFYSSDMAEEEGRGEFLGHGRSLTLALSPFEVRTVRAVRRDMNPSDGRKTP